MQLLINQLLIHYALIIIWVIYGSFFLFLNGKISRAKNFQLTRFTQTEVPLKVFPGRETVAT